MTLKVEEQQVLDNFKAQYNSIKTNISAENDTLEKLLKQKTETYDDITLLETKRENVSIELDKLLKIKKDTLSILKQREVFVSKKEKTVASKEIALFKEEEKVIASLNKKTNAHIDIINKLEQDRTKAREFINLLNLDIDSRIQKIDKIKDEEKSLKKTFREMDSEVVEQSKSLSNIENSIAKKKETSEKELKVLFDKKDKLVEDTEEIRTTLDDREKKVSIREADAAVIVRRLKKIYKKMYPNIELKI